MDSRGLSQPGALVMEFQASAERVFFKGNQYMLKGNEVFKTFLDGTVKVVTCCLYQNFSKIRKSF